MARLPNAKDALPKARDALASLARELRSARPLRCALAGVGAFAITAGLLLRFYAAPALVTAPPAYYGTQVLSDPHATYFNQATLTTKKNATLSDVNTIRGDAAASTGSTVTWDSYSYIWDPDNHVTLSSSYQRAVFNRQTGELLDCCGAAIDDDPRIRQYGIAGMFWPIGTKKTTYMLYDTSTDRAWPAVFSGTAMVQGILTYKYTQQVPATVVQKLPGTPMSLLGVPGASYTVTANRTYQADNTFWIDPRTGIPVDVDEKIASALHDPADIGSLTVASADLKMSQASQRSLAALANSSAAQIVTVRLTGPLAGVILGVLLLLAAAWWPRRVASDARRAAVSLVRRAARKNSRPLYPERIIPSPQHPPPGVLPGTTREAPRAASPARWSVPRRSAGRSSRCPGRGHRCG